MSLTKKQFENQNSLGEVSPSSDASHPKSSFSSPRDFLLTLAPVALGLLYLVIHNQALVVQKVSQVAGAMDTALAQDASLMFAIVGFCFFLGGLAGAIGLLHGIQQLEQNDSKFRV